MHLNKLSEWCVWINVFAYVCICQNILLINCFSPDEFGQNLLEMLYNNDMTAESLVVHNTTIRNEMKAGKERKYNSSCKGTG